MLSRDQPGGGLAPTDRSAAVEVALLLTGDPWCATQIVDELAAQQAHDDLAVLRAVVQACRSADRRRRRGDLRVVAAATCPRARAARAALDHLPFRLRAVVVLREFHRLDEAATAQVMRSARHAVARRHRRALDRLARAELLAGLPAALPVRPAARS